MELMYLGVLFDLEAHDFLTTVPFLYNTVTAFTIVSELGCLSERWDNVANGIMVNLIPLGRKGTTVSPIHVFRTILSVPFH